MTATTDPNADPVPSVGAVLTGPGPGADHVSGSAGSASPAPRVERRLARTRAVWSSRRLVVVAALAPPLAAALVVAGGQGLTGARPAWVALVVVIAVACSATLASYLPRPGTGLRLDVGCTPCAAVAALSVVFAAVVLGSNPQDVPTALIALAVAAFGVRQRLTNPSTCAV